MSGESVRSDPSARLERLTSILDQLACPACSAGLRLDANQLACRGCERVYPIIDGIPVLTAERYDRASHSDRG